MMAYGELLFYPGSTGVGVYSSNERVKSVMEEECSAVYHCTAAVH